MNKYYMTLGQTHVHSINGKTLDKDSVGVINADNYEQARMIAFDLTGGKFHRLCCFPEEVGMEYFPRGLIEVN